MGEPRHSADGMREAGERLHLAILRLFVLAVYRPVTHHVIRPLAARLSRR